MFNAFAHRWLGHDDYFFTLADGKLIEIAGLGHKFQMEYVSAADKLNGISYKGKAQFFFEAYRSVTNKTGPWTPWQDTQEYNNSLMAFWGNQFGRVVPKEFEQGFNLQYTVIQQDGHWHVWSDSKLRFVDQRLLESENQFPVLPGRELVQKVLNQADSPRKKAQREGEEAKKSPRESGSEMKKTMDMLRGRGL